MPQQGNKNSWLNEFGLLAPEEEATAPVKVVNDAPWLDEFGLTPEPDPQILDPKDETIFKYSPKDYLNSNDPIEYAKAQSRIRREHLSAFNPEDRPPQNVLNKFDTLTAGIASLEKETSDPNMSNWDKLMFPFLRDSKESLSWKRMERKDLMEQYPVLARHYYKDKEGNVRTRNLLSKEDERLNQYHDKIVKGNPATIAAEFIERVKPTGKKDASFSGTLFNAILDTNKAEFIELMGQELQTKMGEGTWYDREKFYQDRPEIATALQQEYGISPNQVTPLQFLNSDMVQDVTDEEEYTEARRDAVRHALAHPIFGLNFKPREDESGFFGDLYESTSRGWKSAYIDRLMFDYMSEGTPDKISWEDMQRLREDYQEMETQDPIRTARGAWWNPKKVANQVAQILPPMVEGRVQGLLLQSVGVPMIVGSSQYWFRQGAGMMYEQMRGAGVDHRTAQKVAVSGGLIYAAIEQQQVGSLLKGSGFLSKIGKEGFKGKGMKAILGGILKSKEFKKRLSNYGLGVLEQSLEEGVQKLTEDISLEIAIRIDEDQTNDEGKTFGQITGNALEEFWQSVPPMMVLNILGLRANVNSKLVDASAKKQKQLENIPEAERTPVENFELQLYQMARKDPQGMVEMYETGELNNMYDEMNIEEEIADQDIETDREAEAQPPPVKAPEFTEEEENIIAVTAEDILENDDEITTEEEADATARELLRDSKVEETLAIEEEKDNIDAEVEQQREAEEIMQMEAEVGELEQLLLAEQEGTPEYEEIKDQLATRRVELNNVLAEQEQIEEEEAVQEEPEAIPEEIVEEEIIEEPEPPAPTPVIEEKKGKIKTPAKEKVKKEKKSKTQIKRERQERGRKLGKARQEKLRKQRETEEPEILNFLRGKFASTISFPANMKREYQINVKERGAKSNIVKPAGEGIEGDIVLAAWNEEHPAEQYDSVESFIDAILEAEDYLKDITKGKIKDRTDADWDAMQAEAEKKEKEAIAADKKIAEDMKKTAKIKAKEKDVFDEVVEARKKKKGTIETPAKKKIKTPVGHEWAQKNKTKLKKELPKTFFSRKYTEAQIDELYDTHPWMQQMYKRNEVNNDVINAMYLLDELAAIKAGISQLPLLAKKEKGNEYGKEYQKILDYAESFEDIVTKKADPKKGTVKTPAKEKVVVKVAPANKSLPSPESLAEGNGARLKKLELVKSGKITKQTIDDLQLEWIMENFIAKQGGAEKMSTEQMTALNNKIQTVLDNYKPAKGDLYALLNKAVFQNVKSQFKKKKKVVDVVDVAKEGEQAPIAEGVDTTLPSDELVNQELNEQFEDIAKSLPKQQRQIYNMLKDGKSVDQIAKKLKTTKANVWKQRSQMKRIFLEDMEKASIPDVSRAINRFFNVDIPAAMESIKAEIRAHQDKNKAAQNFRFVVEPQAPVNDKGEVAREAVFKVVDGKPTIVLYADAINGEKVDELIKHEAFVHGFLRSAVGEQSYQELLESAPELVGEDVAQDIRNRYDAVYEGLENKEELILEEMLARYAQKNDLSPTLIDKIVKWIKDNFNIDLSRDKVQSAIKSAFADYTEGKGIEAEEVVEEKAAIPDDVIGEIKPYTEMTPTEVADLHRKIKISEQQVIIDKSKEKLQKWKENPIKPTDVTFDRKDRWGIVVEKNASAYKNNLRRRADNTRNELKNIEMAEAEIARLKGETVEELINEPEALNKELKVMPPQALMEQGELFAIPTPKGKVLPPARRQALIERIKAEMLERKDQLPDVQDSIAKIKEARDDREKTETFDETLASVEEQEKALRSLRAKLNFHLPETMALERTKAELAVANYTIDNGNKIRKILMDYARAIKLTGEVRNRVGTLMKNTRTSAGFKKALRIMDETLYKRQNATLKQEVKSVVNKEMKRLKDAQGKKIASGDAKINNVLMDYLEGFTYLSDVGFEALEKRLEYFEKNPDAEVAPEMLADLAKLSQKNVNTMDNIELQETLDNIKSIKKTGALKQKLRKGLEARERERSVEGSMEGLKKDDNAKWLEQLPGFFKVVARPERIAKFFGGWMPNAEFKKQTFDKILKAEHNKQSGIEKAVSDIQRIFDKLKSLSEIKNKKKFFLKTTIEAPDAIVRRERALGGLGQQKNVTLAEMLGEGLTLNNLMHIYANSKNEDNRAHLRGSGLSDANIDEAISLMPQESKEVVDEVIAWFDSEQYDRLNETFQKEHNIRMPRIEDYFPIRRLDNQASVNNELFRDVMARYGMKAGMQKGMTKKRTGDTSGFRDFDFTKTTMDSIRDAEHYIAYADQSKQVRQYLNNPEIREAMLNKSTAATSAMNKWLETATQGKLRASSNAIDVASDMFRRQVTPAWLGWNIVTQLKQVPSFLTGVGRLNNKSKALETLWGFMTDRDENQWWKGKMWDEVKEKSVEMRNRHQNWEREYAETAEALFSDKALGDLSWYKKAQSKSMALIQKTDQLVTTILWKSKYDEAKEEKKSESEAIKEADELIRSTQPMGGLIHLAEIHRAGGIARAMTMFTNQLNNYANLHWETLAQAKQKGAKGVSQDVFFNVLLPATLMYVIASGGRTPEDDPEGWLEVITKQLFGGAFGYNEASQALTGLGTNAMRRSRGVKERDPFINLTPTPFVPLKDALTSIPSWAKIMAEVSESMKTGKPISNSTRKQIFKTVQAGTSLGGVPGSGPLLRAIKGMSEFGKTKDPRNLIWSSYSLKEPEKTKQAKAQEYLASLEE